MQTSELVVPHINANDLRILLVEDDDGDVITVTRRLQSLSGWVPEVVRASSRKEAKQELLAKDFDVVLLDLGLPDGEGWEGLEEILECNVPVVVLTGCSDQALAVEAVRRGAQDYFYKSELDRNALRRALHQAIERHRLHCALISAHRREQEMMENVLSHVSHELRTPLTAACNFVESAASLREET